MEYQYDQLGRLLSAATQGAGGWGLAWNHDGFGNLTQQSVTKGSLTGFTHSVNGTTNRINGQYYDANGNWGGSFGQSQSYDIENRIRTAAGPQFSESYLYSARNERMVSQRDQDRHRVHFYGADGLLLGIYTLEITQQNPSYTYPVRLAEQERIYFGGRLMQIGGEWVATDRLGSVVRKGTTNYKYAPYGQEIGGATANDTNKFATYTRDSLSGLDYALNRYYKPEWGRFTSPDPYQASGGPADPGSWNRYAYVGGDPVNWYDPPGLQKCRPGWICFSLDTRPFGSSALPAPNLASGQGGKDMYEAQEDAGFGEIAEDTPGGLLAKDLMAECSTAEFIMGECLFFDSDAVSAALPFFRKASQRVPALLGWSAITRYMGSAAERLVGAQLGGIPKNTTSLGGRGTSIPDFWDKDLRQLIEVKNASFVSLTHQLRSFLEYTQRPENAGYTFHLYVNKAATLSPTIQALVDNGQIILHHFIWP